MGLFSARRCRDADMTVELERTHRRPYKERKKLFAAQEAGQYLDLRLCLGGRAPEVFSL